MGDFSFQVNRANLKKQQDKTIKAAIGLLDSKQECVIVRPTGFGKTYIGAKIAEIYDSVLYVYPSNTLKESAQASYEVFRRAKSNTTSYYMISLVKDVNNPTEIERCLKAHEYSLIISDEMHCMGAAKFKEVMYGLRDSGYLDGTHILGLTATEIRMDQFDVTGEFFHNNTVYDYTMLDAIRDGILPEPMYVRAVANVVEEMSKLAKMPLAETNATRSIREELSRLSIELAEKVNAPEIIWDTVHKAYPELPTYMKFIAFSPTIAAIDEHRASLYDWLRQAFPEMELRFTRVTSAAEDKGAFAEVMQLDQQENTIDVIQVVGMLTYGYHVDNITGIFMLRCTDSSVVFAQQLGRCMSVISKYQPIVFDFVDNFNRDYVYNNFNKVGKRTYVANPEKLGEIGQVDIQTVHLIDYSIAFASLFVNKISPSIKKYLRKRIWEMHVNAGFNANECYYRIDRCMSRENIQKIIDEADEWLNSKKLLQTTKEFGG